MATSVFRRPLWFLVFLAPLPLLRPAGLAAPPADAGAAVDFNRQVRPILSEHCFACHGPDEKARKAKLRLDVKEAALGHGTTIVPGKSAESELIARIAADLESERMPPAKTGKKLSKEQIELLRRWIDQGARWSDHWAFVKPERPPLPAGAAPGPANPIDRFLQAAMARHGLKPAAEADRETLIRRVTLDLTGLPPTPEEVDAFLADSSPLAYEKVVDRLLASPRYGERMALEWLDAARFADTHGYHIDSGRDMTPWRDWVIEAFNRNLPFDQFTIEQIAGDLLPSATREQRIASGFNRNHMINFEGGAIPAEYHTAYIVDRVNTTGTVWLGLTIGCAQCHEHKYDPISQKEYYQLYAFFHNIPEKGLDGNKGNAAPMLRLPTAAQEARRRGLRAEQLHGAARSAAGLLAGGIAGYRLELDAAARLAKEEADLEKQIASVMVMEEMPRPRDTFVLERGQYDKKGEKVTAATPAFLHPLPADAPANRLGLARWLVDPANPLTARVIVNRYWQMYFGQGLVRTPEDFGSQGERPTHPELLDWLACEFMDPQTGDSPLPPPRRWDIKHIQRLIVTSASYRQSSRVTPELLSKDPDNRLLARMPRLRLHAEFIRDQALAISGLLNGEIGGKSVSPYQPPGIWEELASREDGKNWTAQTYEQSKGKDLYRRTMYTFWKRTAPPPSLLTFDAPDREVCTVRRPRTNTPLQALVLMNDPTYVEASRKLAERLLLRAEGTDERLTLAFRLATARRPSAGELAVLRQVHQAQLGRFRGSPAAAHKLLATGESPLHPGLDPAELAAWTMVASVILNLDETVTRG